MNQYRFVCRSAGQPVSRFCNSCPCVRKGINRQTGKPANRQTIKGFTLIELMIVVIIIAALAAMVVPRLAGRSEQAKIAVARADVNANIAMALKLFELDNGGFPSGGKGV